MYRAIEDWAREMHPTNYLNRLSFPVCLKYRKQVTDADQMIPIFACIPTPERTPGTARTIMFESIVFKKTTDLCNSWEAKWTGNNIFTALANFGNAVDERFTFLNRSSFNKRNHTYSNDKEFAVSELDILLRGSFNKTELLGMRAMLNKLIDVDDEDMVDYVTDKYASYVQAALPENSTKTGTSVKMIDWKYGLFIPAHYRMLDDSGSWLDYTLYLNGEWTTHPSPKAGQHFITKYGYLAEIRNFPDVSPLRGIHNPQTDHLNPGVFNGIPPKSSFNGITSHFSLMVRAHMRPTLIAASLAGTLESVDWKKGDVELWEDADIKQSLHPDTYALYHKNWFKQVRNGMKGSVRSVKNLTGVLFDYEKQEKPLSPVAVNSEILNKINAATKLLIARNGMGESNYRSLIKKDILSL